jgi:hypothetical protein
MERTALHLKDGFCGSAARVFGAEKAIILSLQMLGTAAVHAFPFGSAAGNIKG